MVNNDREMAANPALRAGRDGTKTIAETAKRLYIGAIRDLACLAVSSFESFSQDHAKSGFGPCE
jgi:hypothetical protein